MYETKHLQKHHITAKSHICKNSLTFSGMSQSGIPALNIHAGTRHSKLLNFTFQAKYSSLRLTCAQCRHRGRWDRSRRLDPGIWGRCICSFHNHIDRGRYRAARSWQGRWKSPGCSRRRCLCSWHHRCTSCIHSVHVLAKHRQ